jgi:hypothetical protein
MSKLRRSSSSSSETRAAVIAKLKDMEEKEEEEEVEDIYDDPLESYPGGTPHDLTVKNSPVLNRGMSSKMTDERVSKKEEEEEEIQVRTWALCWWSERLNCMTDSPEHR